MKSKLVTIMAALIALLMIGIPQVAADTPLPFFQGFEEDTDGWNGDLTQVGSGNNGVTSAEGDYHAVIAEGDGPYTWFSGVSYEFPEGGYSTMIDIYLDVDYAMDNYDSELQHQLQFDWTCAASGVVSIPFRLRVPPLR